MSLYSRMQKLRPYAGRYSRFIRLNFLFTEVINISELSDTHCWRQSSLVEADVRLCLFFSHFQFDFSSIHLTFLRLTSTSEQTPIHRSRYILPFIFARPDLSLYLLHTTVLNGTLKFWFSFGQYSTSFESVLRSAAVAILFSLYFIHLMWSQEDYCIFAPCSAPLVGSFPSTHFYFTHSLSSAIQGSQPFFASLSNICEPFAHPFMPSNPFFCGVLSSSASSRHPRTQYVYANSINWLQLRRFTF